MKRPLAYRVRPTTFDEVIGQDHLVGPNGIIRKFMEKDTLPSLVLYGPPGTGKSTIAAIIGSMFGLRTYHFNASVDNKKILQDCINETKVYGNALLIVDEIHRMKRDIQDYLLPFVEDGTVILVGLTTVNPYHSVNPAIRSRVHILKLEDISQSDIKKALLLAIKKENVTINLSDEVLDYISELANGEIRFALNMLEITITLYDKEEITLEKAKKILTNGSIKMDQNGNDFYDTLSGLQKSIRGSEVNASLYYLGKLLLTENLIPLTRRLSVIAYEDIGLANPGIGPKVIAACDAALKLGMPEARIPLSVVVVDMALSPKSNSAYTAIDQAISDIEAGIGGEIPLHLKNVPTYSSKDHEVYTYPHDYEDALVKQQYFPNGMTPKMYYDPKYTGKYERALAERYHGILEYFKGDKIK